MIYLWKLNNFREINYIYMLINYYCYIFTYIYMNFFLIYYIFNYLQSY